MVNNDLPPLFFVTPKIYHIICQPQIQKTQVKCDVVALSKQAMIKRMVIRGHTSPLSCFGKSLFTTSIYHIRERKITMAVKRIKINDVEEKMLEEIKRVEGLTNIEVFNKIIRAYYEKAFNHHENKMDTDVLNEIKEYVLLLVKNSPTLPNDPVEMQHYVNSTSRFEKSVKEKIKTNEKKFSCQ